MSLMCKLRTATDDEIAALHANPSSVEPFLYGPDLDDYAFQDQLEESGHLHHLEKAWHGLHFLLARTAPDERLGFLLAGEPVGDEIEWGDDLPRAHSAAEVCRIAGALDATPPELLRERFDPAEMTELNIYPDIWDRPAGDEDTFGFLLQHYEPLRAFVRRAAERRLGLIVWIS